MKPFEKKTIKHGHVSVDVNTFIRGLEGESQSLHSCPKFTPFNYVASDAHKEK